MDALIITPQTGWVQITLNRPAVKNALNTATLAALAQTLARADADPAIHAALIHGAEGNFAAGADIAEIETKTSAEAARDPRKAHWAAIRGFSKPLIAAVDGFALGGGLELALMADLILVDPDARLGLPETNLGLIPGAGGTQRLPRAVGKSKAMDMALTGRMMDAAEAERAGLVSRVVPFDKLADEALGAALIISDFSQLAVMAAKESVNRAFESGLSDGVMFERRLFHALFATNDQKEGMDAFVNKRKAVFTHS